MKVVKLFVDANFIKSKLGDEFKNSGVVFTKAEIGEDNTVTFTCILTEEKIVDDKVCRIKIG